MEQEIKSQVQELDIKVDTVTTKVNTLDVKFDLLLAVLRGNAINTDDKGLLGKSTDHENRITKLENKFNKAIWIAVGVALATGVGLREIVGLFDKN